MPMLVRAHAIDLKVVPEAISLHVSSIYTLQLCMPREIDTSKVQSFFDVKLRKLFVVMTSKPPKEEEEEEIVEETTPVELGEE